MASGDRSRHHLLVDDVVVAFALMCAFGWPLVCVRGTWWALHAWAPTTASEQLGVAAAVLTTISFFTLTPRPLVRLRSVVTWRSVGFTASAGSIAYLVLGVAGGISASTVLAPMGVATFAAALAEEVVFRRFLPDRLSAVLRQTQARPLFAAVAVIVVPQMAFATAHAENTAFAGAHAGEFATLFVAGMLYQGVARIAGLWAAASVHGAINLIVAVASLPR